MIESDLASPLWALPISGVRFNGSRLKRTKINFSLNVYFTFVVSYLESDSWIPANPVNDNKSEVVSPVHRAYPVAVNFVRSPTF